MRKEFNAAHKAEIIARAYGKGAIYGAIAEWLLDPARPNQADISPDDTASIIAARLSGGAQPRLTYAYLDCATQELPPRSEWRTQTLLSILEEGPVYKGLSAHTHEWHLQ